MKIKVVRKILELWTFKLFILIGYSAYLLLSTLFGTLILSLALYFLSPFIGLGEPFTVHELITWIDKLPENYKTATFSSLLTIVGFLIAFSMGATQQKQQFIRQMKLDVASDIEDFFNEASRNLTSASIFSKQIISLINSIDNKTETSDAIDFLIRNMEKDVKEFKIIRAKLVEQSIEVHRFPTKHFMTLASSAGSLKKLKLAEKALSNMVNHLYFPLPHYIIENDLHAAFIRQVDIGECEKYIKTYNENFDLLNGSSGGLRGGLVAGVTGINTPFVLNLLKIKLDDF